MIITKHDTGHRGIDVILFLRQTPRPLSVPFAASRRRRTERGGGQALAQNDRLALTARDLIKTADDLVPYSKCAVNVSMLVWQAIAELETPDARVSLLEELTAEDIERLWRLSAGENRDQRTTMNYRVWDDLPTEASGAVTFRAKRTTGGRRLWYTFGLDDSDVICGRVEGVLSRLISRVVARVAPSSGSPAAPSTSLSSLSSYGQFTATVGTGLVGAGTCDLVIDFAEGGDSREFVRAAGPGVFVAAAPHVGRTSVLVKL